MNTISTIVMVKKARPYYFKNKDGKKTDEVKGLIIEGLEISKGYQEAVNLTDITLFPLVEQIKDYADTECYQPFEFLFVEYSVNSYGGKPYCQSVQLLAEVDCITETYAQLEVPILV